MSCEQTESRQQACFVYRENVAVFVSSFQHEFGNFLLQGVAFVSSQGSESIQQCMDKNMKQRVSLAFKVRKCRGNEKPT